jgi:hypothetical protein
MFLHAANPPGTAWDRLGPPSVSQSYTPSIFWGMIGSTRFAVCETCIYQGKRVSVYTQMRVRHYTHTHTHAESGGLCVTP